MKKGFIFCLLTIMLLSFLSSCQSSNTAEKSSPSQTQSKITDSLTLLKTVAKSGDLVTRLGDDFLSHQIRYMSQQDPSFSHVGIVVKKDGETLVCHIYPDTNGGDTVRYEPVDSFLNPQKNLSCALFRYNFSEPEAAAFVKTLDSFAKHGVRFDKLYDLSSNEVYCSEMIYKSLVKATNGRLSPELTSPPKNMLPLLMKYFAKEKPTEKQIAERRFVSIDKLYLMPECNHILSFKLQSVE